MRVAYLGGSITAASGWRVQSLAELQKRFPKTEWSEINAAIGGTGSDLGVFRVQAHALEQKPDLLFIEFAVNDGGAEPGQIQRCMEGIVRQAWASDPDMDIVFVYTISTPSLSDAKAGKISRAVTAMEEVADFYGIPSVHFGVEVAKRVTDGRLIFQGEADDSKEAEQDAGAPMIFSRDGVHPFPNTGHKLYTEALFRAWDQWEKQDSTAARAEKPASHSLTDPLRQDNWENAKIVYLRPDMLTGQWTPLSGTDDPIEKHFHQRLSQMWRATKPGDSIYIRFRGKAVGFFDILGPEGGALKVKLDDADENVVKRIDGYCTYPRLGSFFPSRDLDDQIIHELTVTLEDTVLDKREILFERNRGDFDKNPKKYEAHVWSLGGILLLGDLVE